MEGRNFQKIILEVRLVFSLIFFAPVLSDMVSRNRCVLPSWGLFGVRESRSQFEIHMPSSCVISASDCGDSAMHVVSQPK
jgi:hypothetical protein